MKQLHRIKRSIASNDTHKVSSNPKMHWSNWKWCDWRSSCPSCFQRLCKICGSCPFALVHWPARQTFAEKDLHSDCVLSLSQLTSLVHPTQCGITWSGWMHILSYCRQVEMLVRSLLWICLQSLIYCKHQMLWYFRESQQRMPFRCCKICQLLWSLGQWSNSLHLVIGHDK